MRSSVNDGQKEGVEEVQPQGFKEVKLTSAKHSAYYQGRLEAWFTLGRLGLFARPNDSKGPV